MGPIRRSRAWGPPIPAPGRDKGVSRSTCPYPTLGLPQATTLLFVPDAAEVLPTLPLAKPDMRRWRREPRRLRGRRAFDFCEERHGGRRTGAVVRGDRPAQQVLDYADACRSSPPTRPREKNHRRARRAALRPHQNDGPARTGTGAGMSAADTLLSKLHNVHSTSASSWLAGCPLCQSRKGRPLALRETADGRLLLHAFCGCATDAVLGALGLQLSDLFPQRVGDHFAPARSLWSARDVQDLVLLEATIVGILASDFLQKRSIDETDWARLAQATGRLVAIVNEVRI